MTASGSDRPDLLIEAGPEKLIGACRTTMAPHTDGRQVERGHRAGKREIKLCGDVDTLLTRKDVALRERVLWRTPYQSVARSTEVLRLDVDDLDLANCKTKVTRKGGAVDVIVWQTGTARFIPRLVKGRKVGPLFLTDRRPPGALPRPH